jgi:DNA-binding beta-propeller fold protein YncE
MAKKNPSADRAVCNQPAREAIASVKLPGHPFAAIASQDGCSVFVSLASSDPLTPSGIAVLNRTGGSVSLKCVIPVERNPQGLVLTHDGKLLIVADDDFVVFLDVGRMIADKPHPVLGYLSDLPNASSIYVNVTADDKYLFVSDEGIATITVIDLERARENGFQPDAMIGRIAVGVAPIALTFSPDQRYLYTTSELARPSYGWPAACKREGEATARIQDPEGALIVIDVKRAVTDPVNSVVAKVPGGCSPVRLALSPDGKTAYVTARNDNALLAFDTERLRAGSLAARIASVPVGPSPVGIATVAGGNNVVVANSNRFFGRPGHKQALTVIDARRLSSGEGAVLGTIPAGIFPRELHLTSDQRTLLVTDYGSDTLQLIDVARLSRIVKKN